MAKNNLSDLNDHLFSMLELLGDDEEMQDQEGRYRATYNTFTFTGEAPNVWKYCGHCFAGEMKHRG